MDRFRATETFVRVAEARSFSYAADSMQVPRSTVSSVIRQLEDHLGVRLLNRTTRRVSLTIDGEAYLERCRYLLEELEETEALLQQKVSRPSGKLRVDVPGRVARTIIIPALAQFFESFPDIELELGVSDRPVDLIAEGVDCALRVGELSDSRLLARRIGLLEQGSFASPGYLRRYGMPRSIAELERHYAVNYASPLSGKIYEWEFMQKGRLQTTPVKSLVTVNNAEAYIARARAGLGLIQVPSYDTHSDVEAGALVEVLGDWRPPAVPISIVYPHRRHLSRRVRAFLDWVIPLLEEQLWPRDSVAAS